MPSDSLGVNSEAQMKDSRNLDFRVKSKLDVTEFIEGKIRGRAVIDQRCAWGQFR